MLFPPGSVVNAKELKSARFEVTVDKKPAFSAVSEIQVNFEMQVKFRNLFISIDKDNYFNIFYSG